MVFVSPVNLNCDFPLKNQLLDMSGFHLSSSSPSMQDVLSLFSFASSKSTLKTLWFSVITNLLGNSHFISLCRFKDYSWIAVRQDGIYHWEP